ncbi:MAG: SDR family NAD(P)-dependent oxidoreductase [Candidatus Woesearchaeota archaeon]
MKTVLITGGEHGLGYALSSLFLENNFRVISFDLTKGRSQKNKEFFKVDITDELQVTRALKKLGDVDFLINNAGVMRRATTFESSVSDFDLLFSVHVKGTWLVTKHVLPKLSSDARVLMISSRHSNLPSNPGLYGLSKRVVEHLADLLEREPLAQKKDVQVKVAILGPFKTKLSETGYTKEEYARRKNLLDKEVVASKVFNLLMSKKKKLIYKERE